MSERLRHLETMEGTIVGGTVGGSGVTPQVAYWTAATTIGGDAGMTYNAATDTLDLDGKLTINTEQTVYNPSAMGTFSHTLYYGDGGGSLLTTGGSEGKYNTGIGIGALFANTTGWGNTATGTDALASMTTGWSNAGFGNNALLYITNGDMNVACGYSAGAYISGGVAHNVTSVSSIYIGYAAMANADGDNNEIIIGYSSTGNGSNTTTIGNAAITDFYVFGNIRVEEDHFVGINAGTRIVFDDSNGFIEVTLGDAAGADEFQVVDSGGGVVATIDSDGTAGFGTSAPDRRLHAEVADVVTNTITYVTRKSHTTSGAAAALYGVGHEDELEDAAGNMQVASEQVTMWADATTAVESPLLRWAVYPKGTVGPGYHAIWGWHDLDDTARTVIPNGAGDVTAIIYFHWVLSRSDASTFSGYATLGPTGGTQPLDSPDEYFVLACELDGSVTVYRADSATTADLMLDLLWI
jgi:hypothetical protein